MCYQDRKVFVSLTTIGYSNSILYNYCLNHIYAEMIRKKTIGKRNYSKKMYYLCTVEQTNQENL